MSHFPTVESWALHSPFSDQTARGPEDVSIGGLWKELKVLNAAKDTEVGGSGLGLPTLKVDPGLVATWV